jgi:hypothetical protein
MAAAEAGDVSERTAWKWVDRYGREGETGFGIVPQRRARCRDGRRRIGSG